MFFGEFGYKIDAKGRVPMPPKFRGALKEGVVLTPGIDKCINAYTLAEWGRLSTDLTGSSVSPGKMRRLTRAIFATAFSTEIDGQGRVALPSTLREYAAIKDDVVVAGVNTYLEIWSRERWNEEKAISQEQAWQIIESLEARP